MADLIKEERYVFCVGTEEHFLRVQELISTPSHWPHVFRIRLAASCNRAARSFYGDTATAVLDMAVVYLSEPAISGQLEIANAIPLENLPNRLTCEDIARKRDRTN